MNYFELHIGDYVEATGHLSFVEDAAYSRLLRKYYATERPLPADLKAVQRLVGARTKEEREAVAIVLEEFFDLRDDGWHNDRCDKEIAKYQAAEPERAAKRENDKERQQRARARRAALFETLRSHDIIPPYNTSTSELQAMVSRVSSQPVTRDVTPPVTRDNTATHFPLPNTHKKEEQELRQNKPSKRGTRLAPDWVPSPSLLAWARTDHPTVNLTNEIAKFRDYWAAKAGAGGVKLDWDATFRNWIRTADNSRSSHAAHQPSRKLSVVEQVEQHIAERKAREQPGGDLIEGTFTAINP